MAILKIARMGHPVLRRRAEPVADPGSPFIRQLIADMTETVEDASGAGLAAPQVHVPLRLVLLRIPPEDTEDGAHEAMEEAAVAPTVLINPEIEPMGAETTEAMEACLSLPGLAGLVPRHAHIRYRWIDGEGLARTCEAQGFHARVVQHECDHLDGILYPMRMTDLSTLTFTSELGRHPPDES